MNSGRRNGRDFSIIGTTEGYILDIDGQRIGTFSTLNEAQDELDKLVPPRGGARPGSGRTRTTFKLDPSLARQLQEAAQQLNTIPEEMLTKLTTTALHQQYAQQVDLQQVAEASTLHQQYAQQVDLQQVAEASTLHQQYEEELAKRSSTAPEQQHDQNKYRLTTTSTQQLQELAKRNHMTPEAMLAKLIGDAAQKQQ
jgi:predicted transcriptional regulator